MASRQAVRSFANLPQSAIAWEVVPKIEDRNIKGISRKILKPIIDWAAGIQELPIAFEGNDELIRKFYSVCKPKITSGSNHHVRFRNEDAFNFAQGAQVSLTAEFKGIVESSIIPRLSNYQPKGIHYVDTILENDLVLFTAYPSYEIRGGGIKRCRWFVDYAEIKKIETFSKYLEKLAILKRWAPLSELYDSLALMHLKKGSRFCGLVGKAALQTHPGLRNYGPLFSLPYGEQFIICEKTVSHLETSVKKGFEDLEDSHKKFVSIDGVLSDLQIQITKGGGNQVFVFYAGDAEIFNLGIIDDSSDRLDVDSILHKIAEGVLH